MSCTFRQGQDYWSAAKTVKGRFFLRGVVRFDDRRQLFVGSAGVSPATPQPRSFEVAYQPFSRLALIAGVTPALPVNALTRLSLLECIGTLSCERGFEPV